MLLALGSAYGEDAGNQKPGPKYQPYIRPFFDDQGFRQTGDLGYVD